MATKWQRKKPQIWDWACSIYLFIAHPTSLSAEKSFIIFLFRLTFLDASSHLYKRVCPAVRPSVGRSPIFGQRPRRGRWPMIPHRAIFSESPSLRVSESLSLRGPPQTPLEGGTETRRLGDWETRTPGDSETRRLGENCPVWNHRSSTPLGPLPKNRLPDVWEIWNMECTFRIPASLSL